MKTLILIIIALTLNSYALDLNMIKVAVIDSGIPTNSSAFPRCDGMKDQDFTGTGIADSDGHATNVANLILNRTEKDRVCFVFLKYYDSRVIAGFLDISNKALAKAIEYGVDIINYSSSGIGSSQEENRLLDIALSKNIIIVAAVGNDGIDLDESCIAFPACYKKKLPMVIVGCNDFKVNHGKVVTIKESCKKKKAGGVTRSGSSQGTAIITGRMIKHFKLHGKASK